MSFRTHTCGELRKTHTGDDVILSGWVHKRRDLGGLIFVDLRDRYGVTQVVFHPEQVVDFSIAESLKYEYIVTIGGTVVAREDKTVNTGLPTGEIEIQAQRVDILSTAKPMPFEIFETDKGEEDEDLRLKYRFLELRRERLKQNLIFRNRMEQYIHQYMQSRDFLHIATPILTVSSPEGARDFLVPSRIHPGKFYALPQAPQQYKQLLMVAGMDRYYQIAPCMRDEDPRADRSPGEFYQLDTEVSFMTRDEFFELMEPLFVGLTEQVARKKVQDKPFPRIPFKDAMEVYGGDRPDLRFDLPLIDVTAWGNASDFQVFANAPCVRALKVDDGHTWSRKQIEEECEDAAKRAHAKGLAWMKYVDGVFDGGITKFFNEKQLQQLQQLLHIEQNTVVFFVADE
ncbi:MAG: aspartate--tRNA ligase, partial [Candidatus Magasanikbacteria bacterium CG11_big_fil_rev_8_21_14_0_20_43_7]